MLGAIIGDVCGSVYEFIELTKKREESINPYEERIKILNKKVPLFTKECSITDDSVLTTAVAKAVLFDKDYEKYIREFANFEISDDPKAIGAKRFGKMFVEWLNTNSQGQSWGNGSAMRVSAIGEYFDTLEEVEQNARLSSICSHNESGAIKCAVASAGCVFLAKNGASKEEIKEYAQNALQMEFNFSLEELRHNNEFTSKAVDSVPLAIFVFLESEDFESTIRNAISIGGDTDTIAAIAGSIAEQCYEIPSKIKKQVLGFMPDYMKEIVDNFNKTIIMKKLRKKLLKIN